MTALCRINVPKQTDISPLKKAVMSSLWYHKNIATGNKCLLSAHLFMLCTQQAAFSCSPLYFSTHIVEREASAAKLCHSNSFSYLEAAAPQVNHTQHSIQISKPVCLWSSSFQTCKAFDPHCCTHWSMNYKALRMLQQGCNTLDWIVWLDMLWQVPLSFCLSHNDEHSTTMAHWGPCGKMNKTLAPPPPQIRCKGLRPCKQFHLISVLMFYASRREQWILLASVTHK